MADRVRRKKAQTEYYFDYSLLLIVLFLLGFGLVMIYSVSSYEAYADYNDAAYYLKKQLIAIILGFVCMIVAANIPYHIWAKLAGYGYGVSFILIALVPYFGIESHGAKRWLRAVSHPTSRREKAGRKRYCGAGLDKRRALCAYGL